MKIIVKDQNIGHCFTVTEVSVHSSLVFCKMPNNEALYPIFLELTKKGLVHSFKPKNEELDVTFFTKHVETLI